MLQEQRCVSFERWDVTALPFHHYSDNNTRLSTLQTQNLIYKLFLRSTSMQGKLLKHNLDTEVVDALKDLKMKLSQNDARQMSN